MIAVTSAMYALLNGTWTDITTDVISVTVTAEWGISGNGPVDRLADPGEMHFDLNNKTKKYSPGSGSALAGWGKGVTIKHIFTFEGEEFVRFRGFVDDIQIDTGTHADRRAHVTVLDWLEYASRHPIVNPGIQTDQTADEALTTILSLMPIQPQATDFETGINTFPTTFDAVNSKTKAYNEFAKIANSELGYIYLRKDKVNGETLVFENAFHRNGMAVTTPFPRAADVAGLLKKEDNDYLLLENGDNLVLNENLGTTLVDENMIALDAEYARNLINRFSVHAYPRRLSASAEVLFQLDEPIAIGSGATFTLKGTYADPDGGLPIGGQDMITPVVTTDYLVNTKEDGSGTNISADLSVSITYGTEGFTALLTNGSGSSGFVTMFNTRGTGIFTYNTLEYVANNEESEDEFETLQESIAQRYKNDLYHGLQYAEKIIEEERLPRTVAKRASLCANSSGSNMTMFLNADVGDRVGLQEDQTAMNSLETIQSVSYQVLENNIVMFQYVLKKIFITASEVDLIGLSVEFAGGAATDAVNFGFVEHIVDIDQRSFSCWIYITAAPVSTSDSIIAMFSDENGVLISLTTNSAIQYYSKEHDAGLGIWITPNSSVPTDEWVNVICTRDSSSASNDPLIYINGVSQSLTESSTPGGNRKTEGGCNLVIGNWKTATQDYTRAFDGLIADVRVYTKVLSQAEVTAIAANDAPNFSNREQDGLVFQGYCANFSELADYSGTLDSTMKVRDRYTGFVGRINGSPIGGQME